MLHKDDCPGPLYHQWFQRVPIEEGKATASILVLFQGKEKYLDYKLMLNRGENVYDTLKSKNAVNF